MIMIASKYHKELLAKPAHDNKREQAIKEMEGLVDKKLD